MAPKDKAYSPSARKSGPDTNTKTTQHEGERIAKVLSRRGIASRREAERLIETGEVRVNGKVITSPALNVTASDRIVVSGKPLPEEEPARVWLYYKPEGLVTSASDEKGRDTVFDHLPEDMPRVMSVGRLDLNSEGLLLLTNDGELKRRLELPATGWLRKYRVRVNGTADDLHLQKLREGITIDGERFKPMQVTIDRQQGANAWLTVGLREGKNREIRRAMNEIGLYVNRLIRVSYGPFRLGELRPGEVEEVKARVLRDQMGDFLAEGGAGEAGEGASARSARPARPTPRSSSAAPRREAAPAARREAGFSARPRRETAGDEAGAPRAARTTSPRSGAASGASARPAREGDGVRSLSRSWSEATTPREGAKLRVSHSGAARRAAETSREDAPASGRRSFGTSAPPRARDGEGFGDRSAAPRSGFGGAKTGKPAPRARDGESFGERSAAPRGSFGGAKTGKPAPRARDGEGFGDRSSAPRSGFGAAKTGKPAPRARDGESFGERSSAPRSGFGGAKTGRPGGDKPRAPGGAPSGPKRPPRSRG